LSEPVAEKAENEKRRERPLSAFSVNWMVPETRTGIEKLPEKNTLRTRAESVKREFFPADPQ
jgi:hypothetical protein